MFLVTLQKKCLNPTKIMDLNIWLDAGKHLSSWTFEDEISVAGKKVTFPPLGSAEALLHACDQIIQ